ncbi:outer membrane beta-barrel protein [Oscillatoria amoena NRMC-F 0135]|nr:outer membrane beta-barrel protein [Oscillatoria amoena NRMC-F 0135]
MSMETNKIDELFRSKLGDYSLDAPDHVWKSIDAKRTPLHKAINYFKRRKAAVVGAFLLIAGISAAAFIGFGPTADTQQTAVVTSQSTTTTPVANSETSGSNAAVATTPSATSAENLANTNTPATNSTTVYTTPNRTNTNNGGNTRNGGNNGGGTDATSHTLTPATNPTQSTSSTDNNTTPIVTTSTTTITDNSTPALTNEEKEVVVADAQPVSEPVATITDETEGTEATDAAEKANKQAIEPQKQRCNSLTADLYAGIGFAGRSLNANGVGAGYFAAKKQAESYTPSFTVGARFNLDLNKSKTLKLRVGSQYTRVGEKLNYNAEQTYTRTQVYIGDIIDPVTGQVIGHTDPEYRQVTETRRVAVSANNSYTFIDVPVQLEYSFFRTEKYSLFATGGASANLRFSQRGSQLNTDLSGTHEIRANNPYKPTTGLSLLAGIGGEYKFSPLCKFSLIAEGTYSHGLNNVMQNNAGMRQNFRTFNASVGLRYRF